MKKQFSKVMAVSLICAMLVPNMAYASSNRPDIDVGSVDEATTSNAEAEGEGEVDGAIYHVIVPTDVNFAVDRFEIANKEQIYGADYPISNQSEFPVSVKVSVEADPTMTNTVLVAKDDPQLTVDSGATTPKAFYFTAIVREEFTLTDSDLVIDNDTLEAASPSDADLVCPIPATVGGKAEFTYALDRLVDGATAITEKNCATFTFGGKVNPNADWETGDLKIKTKFDFKGLPKQAYIDAAPDDGNNLINTAASGPDFPLTAESPVTGFMTIGFNPNSVMSIDKFEMIYNGELYDAFTGDFGGVVDISAGTITIPESFVHYYPDDSVVDATITYKDSHGETKTHVVAVTIR